MKRIVGISFLTVLTLALIFIGKGFYTFKTSDVYQFSKDYVKTNQDVIERIGPVTGYGFMVGGSMNAQKAHLSFKVKGEITNTGVILDLHKEHTDWVVVSIYYY